MIFRIEMKRNCVSNVGLDVIGVERKAAPANLDLNRFDGSSTKFCNGS